MEKVSILKQISIGIITIAIIAGVVYYKHIQRKNREYALEYFNKTYAQDFYRQSEKCDEKINWGSIDICLPSFEGMKEVMTDTWGKYLGTRNNTPENTTIALYIPENQEPAILAKKDLLNDYVKIFSFDYFKDEPVSFKDIYEVYKETPLDYFDNKQETIKNYLRDELGIYSLMEAKLIGKFLTKDKAVTFIQFSIYSTDSGNVAGFTFNSFVPIKNRLIYFMYFNLFQNEESISIYREKHEERLNLFLLLNE